MVEEIFVECSHLVAGGTVNKHRIEDIHTDDLCLEALQIALSTSHKCLTVVVEVYAIAVKCCIMPTYHTHHIELEATLLHQSLALATYLFYEAASHSAHTTDEEVEHLILGEEERIVYHVQCFA